MYIFFSKENLFVLCSLLNDWNYFWNKYCNLPFLAIRGSPYFPFAFLVSSWEQKVKIGQRMSLQNKNMIIIILKGFIKQLAIKQSQFFPQFLFSHWLLYVCFSSFFIKAFANFEKLIRFYWQAFILHKNGESFKILIEIFRQKRIVSNIILAFLDHLKPKISLVGQPW